MFRKKPKILKLERNFEKYLALSSDSYYNKFQDKF